MRPLDFLCTIGQIFGGNANPLYSGQGLRGHPAYDETCGYGSKIASYVAMLIYSLYTPEKTASDGYTAIYGIAETPLEVFEMAVGHVSKIYVKPGDRVERLQEIGEEGNKGIVYQGGQLITLAMQKAGDTRGSHRHWQKRPLLKTKNANESGTYLRTSAGKYRHADGYYYKHAIDDNGYAGCVDFAKPLFQKDMTIGSFGYDVLLLQRALVLQGWGDFEPTGYFGVKTLAAVIAYQKAVGITGTGYCGTKTRQTLNAVYKQL